MQKNRGSDSKLGKDNKSQSILEYALTVIIVAAAIISIGIYYKRSLQGRYRQSADIFSGGSQYSP